MAPYEITKALEGELSLEELRDLQTQTASNLANCHKGTKQGLVSASNEIRHRISVQEAKARALDQKETAVEMNRETTAGVKERHWQTLTVQIIALAAPWIAAAAAWAAVLKASKDVQLAADSRQQAQHFAEQAQSSLREIREIRSQIETPETPPQDSPKAPAPTTTQQAAGGPDAPAEPPR